MTRHRTIPLLHAAGRAFGASILNILYPPRCYGCGRPDAGSMADIARLCSSCEERLEPIKPPFCQRCGETFAGNIDMGRGFTCSNCTGRTLAFDFAIASYEAKGLARELVGRFKYRREIHLRALLGAMLERALGDPRIESAGEWVLIPVPLHSRRRREREFNQAAEIARFAGKRCGREVVDALKRTRYTNQQAQLDRKERLRNLRGAFVLRGGKRLRRKLNGKNLLVVDDVFTTGATIHESAAVLRRELDPPNIAAVTIARG